GIKTVAIYSTIDRDSLHVRRADEALCVGDAPAKSSYLNIEAIIAAACASGAQAIHPGYGFLSENADFARACAAANLVFIGPSIEALEIMGSKQQAKQLLQKHPVPLTPGYHGTDQTDAHLLKESKKIGFPVLLKAAQGGGGKGMRAVHNEQGFHEALKAARREATAYFNDDVMLIEKLIENPRHIEVQLMADQHGNIVHLFERDCSIQRRHQKIIEEAPAPNLNPTLRQTLYDAAINVAKAIDYQGAGTVEFLATSTDVYFMEMNTRLQVEHPVTEMITGLDLVEWQLRIASGEKLPKTQKELQMRGHAIECRIYAEDPEHDFLPSIGQLRYLEEPKGDGIRIETGVEKNDAISQYYDPMISKLVTFGEDREEALHRMQRALTQYLIAGISTNLNFLRAVLKTPAFIEANLTTDFLNNTAIHLDKPDETIALLMAASLDYLDALGTEDPLHAKTLGFKINQSSQWTKTYLIHAIEHTLTLYPLTDDTLTVEINRTKITLHLTQDKNALSIDDGQSRHHAKLLRLSDGLTLLTPKGPITVRHKTFNAGDHEHLEEHQLKAPMPSTVVALLKQKGDHVKAKEGIMILEAMKMEHTMLAPSDGQLMDVYYAVGAQVPEGAQLVDFKPKGA
ncbi:MAG: acetyl/propionyl/methylcrotonyl-CoA carboxylase subunit alpha, partial [Legionellaceae bacterium]